jgi:hypothetical protein
MSQNRKVSPVPLEGSHLNQTLRDCFVLAKSMLQKGLQHIHLLIGKASIRREAVCYFLLSDSLEQVSYGSVTAD